MQFLASLLLNFAESVLPKVLILDFTVQPNVVYFPDFMLILTLLKVTSMHSPDVCVEVFNFCKIVLD